MKKLLSFLLIGAIMSFASLQAISEEEAYTNPEQQTVIQQEQPQTISLGVFKLTAYCPCSRCCGRWANGITASGTYAQEGRTIAVDKRQIPLGTTVIIDGYEYIAEDVGGAIRGKRIDIFHNSHYNALNFGVQYKEVFVRKNSIY